MQITSVNNNRIYLIDECHIYRLHKKDEKEYAKRRFYIVISLQKNNLMKQL